MFHARDRYTLRNLRRLDPTSSHDSCLVLSKAFCGIGTSPACPKAELGSGHLDSILFRHLQPKLGQPCHAPFSQLMKILKLTASTFAGTGVLITKAQLVSGIISRNERRQTNPTTTPKSSTRVRIFQKLLPPSFMFEGTPTIRRQQQQLTVNTCGEAALGRTPPTD